MCKYFTPLKTFSTEESKRVLFIIQGGCMLKIFLSIGLVLSSSAFAQDVVSLDANNIIIQNDEAVFVRTSETPSVVNITFNVPIYICDHYEIREFVKISRLHCGVERQPIVVNDGRGGTRVDYKKMPRTCLVPLQVCAKYSPEVKHQKGTVRINFNLPRLEVNDAETYNIKAKQQNKHGNRIIYSVEPLDTNTETVVLRSRFSRFFRSNVYTIEEKH